MVCGKSYAEFLSDLAARESEGKYDAQNSFGFSGKYQMGEAALIDAGYYKADGTKGKHQDWIGSWTGKDGVNSIEDFLNNSAAQENAIRDYMEKQWQYINRFGLDKYIGQNIGGIEITESGLLAGAHLKGVGSLKRFLTSGGKGTFKDGYGTDIREYLRRFSNYNVPFHGNGLSSGNLAGLPNMIAPWTDLFDASKAVVRRDPLILDLDGDGLETTGVKDGAYFDHDGNGFSEQTGWASSDDGLLVMDRNGDGIINNGAELFGDQTILQNGQYAADGFQALAELDTNADNIIDINDTAFSQLMIWQDMDGDGYSSTDELFTLDETGITSINLTHTDINTTNPNGNTQVQSGTFIKTDGSVASIGGFTLQRDTACTIANEWLDVPDDIAALPDLQGYGNVHDLHQTMARDTTGTLQSLIEQFMAATDVAARSSLMEQILFYWTGSDAIDPASRGPNFDARKCTAMDYKNKQPRFHMIGFVADMNKAFGTRRIMI